MLRLGRVEDAARDIQARVAVIDEVGQAVELAGVRSQQHQFKTGPGIGQPDAVAVALGRAQRGAGHFQFVAEEQRLLAAARIPAHIQLAAATQLDFGQHVNIAAANHCAVEVGGVTEIADAHPRRGAGRVQRHGLRGSQWQP
ncbi:hypothetical protein [Duganella levis]|uniref:hypothetical protein n=1 Tax=Duganella levis TaxID=2692169 RepID=UPI001E64A53A|nr:hypothetical protein [Duganella levis]